MYSTTGAGTAEVTAGAGKCIRPQEQALRWSRGAAKQSSLVPMATRTQSQQER